MAPDAAMTPAGTEAMLDMTVSWPGHACRPGGKRGCRLAASPLDRCSMPIWRLQQLLLNPSGSLAAVL